MVYIGTSDTLNKCWMTVKNNTVYKSRKKKGLICFCKQP